MKLVLVFLSLAAFVAAESIPDYNNAYGYIEKIGIPEAGRIKEQEEQYKNNPVSRIFNGSGASLGQFPFQAGLLGLISGTSRQALCGAVLVSRNRLITAAHCWFDGRTRIARFTVVLGSIRLYSGGTRINTNNVVMHPNWFPAQARNDIAMIRLPSNVNLSNNINVIALPSGSLLNQNFVDELATASGFGMTGRSNPVTSSQSLRFGRMNVISNNQCRGVYSIVQTSNICTNTARQASTCSGDSGGPLFVVRNNSPVLIGITSFGPDNDSGGCEAGLPAAFARISSFISFINQNL